MRSNCLLEAIKAKLKDSTVRIHFLSPELNYGMLHFYWVKGSTVYHFLDPNENKTSLYRICHPFFQGVFKRSSAKAFEKLMYSRMLEQCWSIKKQLAYAKAKKFSTRPTFYNI